MSGVNKVILLGNLGKDPEVRYLEGGTAVAKLTIATSESYKNKEGQKVDQTEWHNVVLWRGLAEIAEKYLRKGSTVYIEGKLRTRSWEDKDHNKRYTTEIVGDVMTMVGGKRSEDGGSGNSGYSDNSRGQDMPLPQADGPTDDLPF